MVATERMKRAETEEELKELQQEKEALRSALCVAWLKGRNSLFGSQNSDGRVALFLNRSSPF